MKDAIEIHETAFVTATYRSSNEELSKDSYSKYWKSDKTDEWIKSYLEKVSFDEPHTHCLRNRYFIETIRELKTNHEIEVLINFGAGFSMYPYLFESDLVHIEIDQKDIIQHKKQQVHKLVESGILPEREIHYLSKDFNLEGKELAENIRSIVNDRRSFALVEGVVFFLSKEVTDNLFDLIREVQSPGSYLGSVSFLESSEESVCFKRLIQFFEEEVVLNTKFEYLTLPTAYYESQPGYDLIEHQDYVSLSAKYSPTNKFENGDLILNENMYLLRRK